MIWVFKPPLFFSISPIYKNIISLLKKPSFSGIHYQSFFSPPKCSRSWQANLRWNAWNIQIDRHTFWLVMVLTMSQISFVRFFYLVSNFKIQRSTPKIYYRASYIPLAFKTRKKQVFSRSMVNIWFEADIALLNAVSSCTRATTVV